MSEGTREGTEDKYQSPGKRWPRERSVALGERFERGLVGLRLSTLDGPLGRGDTLLLPHIEWVRWVFWLGVRHYATMAHPPGYTLPGDLAGVPMGYYAFDRDEEGLRFVEVPAVP